jgi:hypothetical protein
VGLGTEQKCLVDLANLLWRKIGLQVGAEVGDAIAGVRRLAAAALGGSRRRRRFDRTLPTLNQKLAGSLVYRRLDQRGDATRLGLDTDLPA